MPKATGKNEVGRVITGVTNDEAKIITVFDEEMKKLNGGNSSVSKVMDTFSNLTARLGIGSDSQSEGADYILTRLSYDYQITTALFRNSWIVAKGINIIAIDMHKLGIDIKTKLAVEKTQEIQREIKKHRQKLIEGRKWGRLYGGAIGLMMFNGEVMNKVVENKEGKEVSILELPLDLDWVDVDSFAGIYVIDRWNGASADSTFEDDPSSYQYGDNKYYMLTIPEHGTIRVHHSWCLIFKGIQLPRIEKYADSFWGMSELEPVFREIQKRDNTNYSVANLIFQASLRVFKFKDFKQSITTGTKAFQEEMNKRFEALTKHQSNQRATIIDAEDDFSVHSATFTGLDSVLELFMEDICGAFNVPMTKMYMRQGKGFSGDDKSSERVYSDFLNNQQEEHERHNYDKLLRVTCKSKLGAVPDDLDFDFILHYDADTENAKSQLQQELTELRDTFSVGGIPRWLYLTELKERGAKFNLYTNITEEMIASAKKEEEFDEGEQEEDEPEDNKEEQQEETKTKDSKLFGVFRRKK